MAIHSAQSQNIASHATTSDTIATPHERVQAYAYCRELTRNASKSFYLAASLLPAPKRRAIEALYAFARTSDDLVDNQSEPGEALDRWLKEIRNAAHSRHPVLCAWADTCDTYQLPYALADELLAGVGMDLSISRYDTFDDLRVYCYRVASVVGLLSMRIIGFKEGAEPYAIELGIALQLTNILRDIGEDLARGRIYLPREDLERFGIRETDLLDGKRDGRFRAMMRWQIERAEALYQASWRGIALLHPDGQFAVSAAALLYRSILPKIIANDYDVFAKRAYVPTYEKLLLLPRIRLRLNALRRGDPRLPPLSIPA
jgi:15-cis-phytoene synthase